MDRNLITPETAGRLVRVVIGTGRVDLRDRAYVTLLYRCGLRNNECRMLDLADIHLADPKPWLRVRFPKGILAGARERNIGIDGGARAVLLEYLEQRGGEQGPLFSTKGNKRVSTGHIRRKIKIMQKLAGIPGRVHPHALRHAFARSMFDEGFPMLLIQKALGHRNFRTTEIYLDSIGSSEVIDAATTREW